MTARLPVVSGDAGNWGNVLNEFLEVSHRSDGTLKGVVDVVNVKDYGAVGDGVTDDTEAIQAAFNSFTDKYGTLYFPSGTYKITNTLTLPTNSSAENHTGLAIQGVGCFSTSIVNHSTSSNTPALLVNLQGFHCEGIGFWGSAAATGNNCINIVANGSQCRFINCRVMPNNANGFYINRAHTVYIDRCWGINDYYSFPRGTYPLGESAGYNQASTQSFVYIDISSPGDWVNALHITNCVSLGMAYQVYANGDTEYALNITINNNLFANSTNGIYLKNVWHILYEGNYTSEGYIYGFAAEFVNCREITCTRNYVHETGTYDDLQGAYQFTDCYGVFTTDSPKRIILKKNCVGIVISSQVLYRLQDESTSKNVSLINTINGSLGEPNTIVQITDGRVNWFSDSDFSFFWPYCTLGSQILRKTPIVGQPIGKICTVAGKTGSVVQTLGSGPSPVIIPDYLQNTAYDFKITCLTEGVTGVATYKLEKSAIGTNNYTVWDDDNTILTTELSHMPKVNGGFNAPFGIYWPKGVTYVAGDTWTLTSVIAPAFANLHTLQ